MKHLNRFLIASFLIMTIGSVNAQDETNPWAISVGANSVDFFPTGANGGVPLRTGESASLFEELYNAQDHWNTLPSLSYITVSRYIGKGFVAGISGSINEIGRIGDRRTSIDLEYYSLDAELSYGFKELIKSKWLDPFATIGGGYTALENEVSSNVNGFVTVNGGVGVRFWFSDNINIFLKSQYKQDFQNDDDIVTTSVRDIFVDQPILDTEGEPMLNEAGEEITENVLVNQLTEPTGILNREHFQHSFGFGIAFGGKDTDGDGVSDKNDACPTVAGLEAFNGCPDSDGDGIEDSKDTCPTVAGIAEFNGCADSDGDGIPDNTDTCPTIAGIATLGGCPDADADGITDADDNCPNEAGPRANTGCPYPDTDGDGILDKDDNCPTVAGTAAQNGCAEPVIPQISVEVINDLNVEFKSVLFDNNKATIRRESYATLDNIASIMREYTSTVFLIEGHTDSRGSDSYNLSLSDKRAASVRTYLTGKGIPNSRIQSKGFGEVRPIASNQTEAGRQENRRVEVSIISQ